MAPEPTQPESLQGSLFDVVICGGGLAGLTLMRQLQREQPDLKLLLLEKSERPLPDACHKVGESSVELGSHYFESLGIKDYLVKEQIIKFGLRFFPGGGQLPLDQRLEIGPMQEPIVPSYQLDRGRFETDLRGWVDEAEGTMLEGVKVKDIALRQGEEPHTVSFETRDGAEVSVQAKWAVDATGRNALLRRRLKLTRGTRHAANAGWFRVDGRVDITKMVPETSEAWHAQETAGDRWRSTNHLMGKGYWVWIIPLSSGKTSIGVVVHDSEHGFGSVRSLEQTMAFIEEHEPVLFEALKGHGPALDFLCLRGYSHTVGRCWSTDRWALVGEAGAFVDPLYSPGSDFIAYANTFTGELIRLDREGGDLETHTRHLNLVYRALVSGNVDIFRDAAPVYGHGRAMLAKIYWDNFSYWSYPCQYFLQKIYRLAGPEGASFVTLGQRFVELSNYMQSLLREWALLAPENSEPGFWGMPRFPSVLVDAHLALQDDMTPEQTHAYMEKRAAEGEEIAGELLLRVVSELGADKGRQLVDNLKLARWNIRMDSDRLAAEAEVGLGRRKLLSPIARDVERSLGRAPRIASEDELRALLAPILRKPAAKPAEAHADA